MRYTIVVEWPAGQEPSIGAADEFKGGKVCAVQFSDALAELQALYEQNPGLQEPAACTCRRCIREKGLTAGGLPLSCVQMIVCPDCGNKRCPKASDHRLACTNSNAAHQPGSIYA